MGIGQIAIMRQAHHIIGNEERRGWTLLMVVRGRVRWLLLLSGVSKSAGFKDLCQ